MNLAILTALITRLLGPTAGRAAKALLPAVGTVIAVAVQWASTGAFDRPELITAITGLAASVLTFLVPNEPAAHRTAHTTRRPTGGSR